MELRREDVGKLGKRRRNWRIRRRSMDSEDLFARVLGREMWEGFDSVRVAEVIIIVKYGEPAHRRTSDADPLGTVATDRKLNVAPRKCHNSCDSNPRKGFWPNLLRETLFMTKLMDVLNGKQAPGIVAMAGSEITRLSTLTFSEPVSLFQAFLV
jgi:hypothetical protein